MSDNEYEVEDRARENTGEGNNVPEEEEQEEGSSSRGRGQSSSVPSLRGAPEHEREDIIRRQNAEVRIYIPHFYILLRL